MKTIPYKIFLTTVIFAGACSSSAKRPTTSVDDTSAEQTAMIAGPGSPQEQIDMAWQELTAASTLLAIEPATTEGAAAAEKRTCDIPAGPQCINICELADSICKNATKICSLADDLGPDDTWAKEKCESGNGICKKANQRCCDC